MGGLRDAEIQNTATIQPRNDTPNDRTEDDRHAPRLLVTGDRHSGTPKHLAPVLDPGAWRVARTLLALHGFAVATAEALFPGPLTYCLAVPIVA